MKFPIAVLVAAALSITAARRADCETWPSRSITAILPYPVGGSTDGIARLVARELSDKLGQSVVIESKSGAGGTIAATMAAKSPPDGYRLFFYASSQAISPLIYRDLQYDPIADFTPIVLIGNLPQVFVTSPKLGIRTLPDFVRHAKAHPGLTFGNSGKGTTGHVAAALLAKKADIALTHVFYRGTAPLGADVVGSQIDGAAAAFFPLILGGDILAVTATQRLPVISNVPTARETGVADIVSGLWLSLAGPAGLPPEIVAKVNRIVNDYLQSPALREVAHSLGMQPMGGTPEEMSAFMRSELDRWKILYRDADITPEGG